jgi:chemotaxis protein methyltransferase CheR
MDTIPNLSSWDVKILATDLDTNVLAHASAGVYDLERTKSVGEKRLRRYFRRGRGEHAGSVKVSGEIRQLITFKQLNLMADWPMSGPFDFMFCRNVVIYFDKDTQRELVSRYADLLRDDGHLFLGHSESLFKVSDRFDLLGQTIYKRIK